VRFLTVTSLALAAALALLWSEPTLAQLGGPNGSGGLECQPNPTNDMTASMAGMDLMTRLQVGVLSKYSWGRGATVRPETPRSSLAVLRERRGLKTR